MRHVLFMIPVCLVFSLVAHADTIFVPGDYKTIQHAINASWDGDVVIVAPGTYVEKLDYHGKKNNS